MREWKMGNEESNYGKFDIEDEAIEVTDNWSLHCASSVYGQSASWSAFASQPGSSRTTLQTLAKNLMVHRHPCIVKYVASWNKNNRFYLVTEEVKPLAQVLTTQSTLQICIGLHSILTALIFLHEKAASSHNNLCCSAVYVTPEGIWKLGGLEYLRKLSDVTPSFLRETRSRRYERAVPPEEDASTVASGVAIDQFAYGVLADELLKKRAEDNLPGLAEFRDLCRRKLQSSDPAQRAPLPQLLGHSFFRHDFIRIHDFLLELPLKPDAEKQHFFSDLTEQLSSLPECIVASQLASLLLSRIVLLDLTAQAHLLPIVLTPKKGADFQSDALFSESTFRAFVVPRLLHMLCVRDSSVRILLLRHFHLFCRMFTRDQLQHQVLPELLVGVKDVSDELVSWTLRALSELVPLLGAATVIGGKRCRLFGDGRPTAHAPGTAERSSPRRAAPAPAAKGPLPERPSPDGGEDHSSSTTTVEMEDGEGGEGGEGGLTDALETVDDADNWSDWDIAGESKSVELEEVVQEAEVSAARKASSLPDIDSLDIKSSSARDVATKPPSDEADFFQDMVPVISKPSVFHVEATWARSKFEAEAAEEGGGWEDDLPDW